MSIIYVFFKTIEALVCAFLMAIACLLILLTVSAMAFILFEYESLLTIFIKDLKIIFTIFFVFWLIHTVTDDEFYESDFDI